MRIGYPCINLTLSRNNPKVLTNRSMIKKTFISKGLGYVSELALANCQDLIKILKWNVKHNIRLFRLSSEIFPWSSEYKLHQLPDFNKIKSLLIKAGSFANTNNLRLTSHPGPFNVLASPK